MNKFTILSLDGGGVRGYLTAKILENMEKHLNEKEGNDIPLGLRFDLIAGTSTGAIIAGLLAKGVSAKEIVVIYESSMENIFTKRSFFKRLFLSKYDSSELEKLVKRYFVNQTTGELLYFNDLQVDLLITAFDLETFEPKIYKSNYSKKNKINYYIKDAIMASTAAPSYFPAYKKRYIDGGVIANNPALIALIDSKYFDRKSKRGIKSKNLYEDINLLSVGTGKYHKKLNLKGLKNSPSWDWAINFVQKISPIKEVLFASQEKIEENKIRLFAESEKVNYLRINPELGEEIELDDINKMFLLKEYVSISIYENSLEKMFLAGEKNDI